MRDALKRGACGPDAAGADAASELDQVVDGRDPPVPAVTPGCHMWLRHQMRPMLSPELAAAQGHMSLITEDMSLSVNKKKELIG